MKRFQALRAFDNRCRMRDRALGKIAFPSGRGDVAADPPWFGPVRPSASSLSEIRSDGHGALHQGLVPGDPILPPPSRPIQHRDRKDFGQRP